MILITGAAGFIGSHLVEQLLTKGEEIIGLDSISDFYDIALKSHNLKLIDEHPHAEKKFTFLRGDITDLALLEILFNEYEIDCVIHLAAMAGVRPSIENAPYYQKVNVEGTHNLLECCKDHDVKKFIFASSSSVYGNNEKVPFSEDDPVDKPISPYAATKKAGELLCHTYHYLYDMDILCLRFFTVYGPRQRPDLAIHKFSQYIINKKAIPFYGDGSTSRDYTYIDDIIDGVVKALNWLMKNKGVYEIVNLGNNEPITLDELVKAISENFEFEVLIDKQPIPKGDVVRTYADISKAQKLFNFKPKTNIGCGLKKFYEWFNSYYKLNLME
ncbi:MAG: GDP-mannose 4,6-dehydratase [Candidatus Cloacimonetes bacterium]|nr:GDP-mannose 4,6-dehydratase [Candidatus Cloacimonadota bacterium]